MYLNVNKDQKTGKCYAYVVKSKRVKTKKYPIRQSIHNFGLVTHQVFDEIVSMRDSLICLKKLGISSSEQNELLENINKKLPKIQPPKKYKLSAYSLYNEQGGIEFEGQREFNSLTADVRKFITTSCYSDYLLIFEVKNKEYPFMPDVSAEQCIRELTSMM